MTTTSSSNKTITTGYGFSFEALLDSQEHRKMFKSYLKTIHNLDPFLFLEQVEEFQVTRSPENRYLIAKQIIDAYINTCATYEINLSKSQRELTMKQFSECSLSHCPRNLFDPLVGTIILELKEDCFLNFTKSETFFEAVAMNGKRLKEIGIVNNVELMRVQLDSNSEFGPESPQTPTSGQLFPPSVTSSLSSVSTDVVSLDFQMGNPTIPKTLSSWIMSKAYDSDTNHWNTLSHSDQGKQLLIQQHKSSFVLTMHERSSPKKFKCIRKQGILPHSVDECLFAYIDCDYLSVVDRSLLFSEHVAYHPVQTKHSYACSIIHYKRTSSFRFKKREMVQSVTLVPLETGYMLLSRSVDNDTIVPQVPCSLRETSVTGILFERLSEKLTKYTVVVLDDGSRYQEGWFSKTKRIRKLSETKHWDWLGAVAARKTFYKKNMTIPAPTSSHRVWDTLQENMNKSEKVRIQ